jgi:hypothetical protein
MLECTSVGSTATPFSISRSAGEFMARTSKGKKQRRRKFETEEWTSSGVAFLFCQFLRVRRAHLQGYRFNLPRYLHCSCISFLVLHPSGVKFLGTFRLLPCAPTQPVFRLGTFRLEASRPGSSLVLGKYAPAPWARLRGPLSCVSGVLRGGIGCTVRCHKYWHMVCADPLYSTNHNSH